MFNNTTEDFRPLVFEAPVTITRMILMRTSVFFGLFGNTMTILAFIRVKKLRTISHALILNIEIYDWTVVVVVGSIHAIDLIINDADMVTFLCHIQAFAVGAWTFGTPLALVAVCINRLIAVAKATEYKQIYTVKFVTMNIALTWLIPIILMMFPTFGIYGRYAYNPALNICFHLIQGADGRVFFGATHIMIGYGSIMIMVVSYAYIIYKLRTRRNSLVRKQNSQKSPTSRMEKRKSAAEMKLAITVMFICAAYVATIVPFYVVTALPATYNVLAARAVLGGIFGQNTYFNFILYVATNERLRSAYLTVLKCQSDSTTSTTGKSSKASTKREQTKETAA